MYKINDVVVYKRDVCRVVGREKSGFTGEKCYILVPYHNTDGSTRMQVPVSNKAGHLRDLITKEQLLELISTKEQEEECIHLDIHLQLIF